MLQFIVYFIIVYSWYSNKVFISEMFRASKMYAFYSEHVQIYYHIQYGSSPYLGFKRFCVLHCQ